MSPTPTTHSPSELADLDLVCHALAHASRRRILCVLHGRGGQMTAGDIADRFTCSWPTTTRHLRVLADAGLVRCVKRGRERLYVLQPDRLRQVVGSWLRRFDDDAIDEQAGEDDLLGSPLAVDVMSAVGGDSGETDH